MLWHIQGTARPPSIGGKGFSFFQSYPLQFSQVQYFLHPLFQLFLSVKTAVGAAPQAVPAEEKESQEQKQQYQKKEGFSRMSQKRWSMQGHVGSRGRRTINVFGFRYQICFPGTR